MVGSSDEYNYSPIFVAPPICQCEEVKNLTNAVEFLEDEKKLDINREK